jgi:hypothetical protein
MLPRFRIVSTERRDYPIKPGLTVREITNHHANGIESHWYTLYRDGKAKASGILGQHGYVDGIPDTRPLRECWEWFSRKRKITEPLCDPVEVREGDPPTEHLDTRRWADIKLVHGDWLLDGDPAELDSDNANLILSDFHSGSTFRAKILLDHEQESTLRDALARGYSPRLWVSPHTSKQEDENDE